MTQPAWYLADHVFLRAVGRYCVFLDLEQDRYLCLETRDMDALAGELHGWPGPVADGAPEGTAALVRARGNAAKRERVIALLRRRGIITAKHDGGKDAAPTRFPAPLRAILDSGSAAPLTARRLFAFLWACTRAAADLRRPGMARAVRRIRRRMPAHAPPANAREAEDLANLFRRLRPWFPRSSLCLFDSLALLHFLCDHGHRPYWVFGVRMEPFEAHCWVQHGDTVLNDTLDYVRSFSPIMII